MDATCCQCRLKKQNDEFYKNSKKKNGLESQCKECVLSNKRKARIKKKGSRVFSSNKVIDLTNCTFKELYITRPCNEDLRMKDLVEELVCLEEKEKFME